MASGRLGVAAPLANTDTTVYEVPAAKRASCNVAIVNRGAADATCKVAFAMAATPLLAEYVEYNIIVPGNGGVFERTAVVASATEKVVVNCSTADCSVRVHGYEEAA